MQCSCVSPVVLIAGRLYIRTYSMSILFQGNPKAIISNSFRVEMLSSNRKGEGGEHESPEIVGK